MEILWIKTHPAVIAAIHATHPELVIFSSCTDLDGGQFGTPRVDTSWGFKDSNAPLIRTERVASKKWCGHGIPKSDEWEFHYFLAQVQED